MKSMVFLIAILISVSTSGLAQSSEVFQKEGIAINGYDAVAFFTEQKPSKGDKEFKHSYKNVDWLFSSLSNIELFKASPEKYAPQYGGYCAFGAADGHKAPTQADTWTILNDKLYFNYNTKVKAMWNKDMQTNIEKADNNWSKVKDSNK